MALLLSRSPLAAGATPEPRFRAVEIDDAIGVGYAVEVGELNGDGKPDIVVVDRREVVWYENPSWEKHVIVKDVGPRDNVCIAVADINGDGLSELALGAHWNPGDTVKSGSVHYLIPPEDRRQPWQAVALHHEPTVHRMRWADVDGDQALELIVKPLHGRGNQDFQGEGLRVLAYEVPTDPATGRWSTELIGDTLHVSHGLDVVQWDDDPADELLLASFEGVFLCDRQADGSWQTTQLGSGDQKSTPHRGASEIRSGRLPDGSSYLATVEPWHGNQVVTYTRPAVSGGQLWQRRVLTDDLQHAHAAKCADLLGVGSDQLVIGWRLPATDRDTVGVRLYVPNDEDPAEWDVHLIDRGEMACEDLAVADLNGDGRPDVLASGRASHNLIIYFNETE